MNKNAWMLAGFLLSLAVGPASSQVSPKAKAWITQQKSCTGDQVEVPTFYIVDVRADQLPQAIAQLETSEAVLLDAASLLRLTGQQPVHEGRLPVLVRAISWSPLNRSVNVSQCGEDIAVFTGSFGGHKIVQDATIVFLPSKPKHVFLSFAGAL